MASANPTWRTRFQDRCDRLDRGVRFAATVAAIAGAVCLTVFVALVTPLVWRPAPSGGYEAMLAWSRNIGLGALAVAVVAAAVRWMVVATARSLRWLVQHPLCAAIGVIGLTLIAVALFLLAGAGGLVGVTVGLVIVGELIHRWRRPGARARIGDTRMISEPPSR